MSTSHGETLNTRQGHKRTRDESSDDLSDTDQPGAKKAVKEQDGNVSSDNDSVTVENLDNHKNGENGIHENDENDKNHSDTEQDNSNNNKDF